MKVGTFLRVVPVEAIVEHILLSQNLPKKEHTLYRNGIRNLHAALLTQLDSKESKETIRGYKTGYVETTIANKQTGKHKARTKLVETVKTYYHFHVVNKRYVLIPAHKQPFFPRYTGAHIPEGHYNALALKYVDEHSLDSYSWKQLVNAQLIFPHNKGPLTPLELIQIASDFLWSISFFGWSEESRNVLVRAL